MQTVSNGDNLHEMLNPVFLEKIRKNIELRSAKYAHSVVKVKQKEKLIQYRIHVYYQ